MCSDLNMLLLLVVVCVCVCVCSVEGCEDVVVKWFQWLLKNLPVFDQ